MGAPCLVSIQVGTPRQHGDPAATGPNERVRSERPWTTGFYKTAVGGPVVVRRTNLSGDAQADLVNHGGPDKAVCVYSLDHYAPWLEVFAAAGINRDAILPGAFGENFSVQGLAESNVCVGDIWRIHDAGQADLEVSENSRNHDLETADNSSRGAMFQVSQPRQPCWKLARRWGIKTLPAQVIEQGKTGWYFRVVEEGIVEAGMTLMLVERPCPEWTVERANWVMHKEKRNRGAARELAAVESLSESWRGELLRRARHDE